MALHKNAEIRRARQVIRKYVDVEVDGSVPVTGPSAANVEWSGVLHPPNNIGLAMGQTYTLVLPGYAPAKILITSEGNPVDGTVTFKGVGKLPASVPSSQVHSK